MRLRCSGNTHNSLLPGNNLLLYSTNTHLSYISNLTSHISHPSHPYLTPTSPHTPKQTPHLHPHITRKNLPKTSQLYKHGFSEDGERGNKEVNKIKRERNDGYKSKRRCERDLVCVFWKKSGSGVRRGEEQGWGGGEFTGFGKDRDGVAVEEEMMKEEKKKRVPPTVDRFFYTPFFQTGILTQNPKVTQIYYRGI